MKVGRRNGIALRAGFTLVELLVVISIIGMLMAMLFPAINAARESGRQNTCRNNMRNIAQAIYKFETTKHHYPLFGDSSNSNATSLMFEILPELERSDIVNSVKNGTTSIANLDNFYLEIVQCPSNPLTKQTVGSTPASNMAFVFNAGRYGLRSSLNTASGSTDPADGPAEKFAGMFFEVGSPNSSADLTAGDGAMNTLLVSESLTGSKWNATDEGLVGFSFNENVGSATMGSGSSTQTFGINAEKTTAGLGPSSNHPNLVNVAFADSHVRTLADTVSYAVYAQLCSPNGTKFGMNLLNEGSY